jgi:hypothetical protein
MNFEDAQFAVLPYLRKLEDMQSADEIAHFMMAEGVKAVRKSPASCAIAEYVRRESNVGVLAFSNAISVMSSQLESSPHGGQDLMCMFREVMLPSRAMNEFMLRFDKGEYPDLEQ